MRCLARRIDAAPRERRRAGFFSLPNILTYGRILAIPALVACFFVRRRLGALDGACGSSLPPAISDFLDGYLARAWQQQSAIGRMLDPIADKLLVAAALLMLAADRPSPAGRYGPAIIILCREILVSGLREFLGELAVGVPVTASPNGRPWCRWSRSASCSPGRAGDKIWPYTTLIGLMLLWIAAILTLYTG